jgi:hypothetical protein
MNRIAVPGNFVEMGVAKGGCAALMGAVAFEMVAFSRSLWLFDSFEGLPEPTVKDFERPASQKTGVHVRPLSKGSCLGTLQEVQELLLGHCGYPKDRVVFVKGWFQETLPVKAQEIGPIAILRIDGDWYESTLCCLEHLYDNVVPGGSIIIDDYESCVGCNRAVAEFFDKRSLSVNLHMDGRGGCYFIKD